MERKTSKPTTPRKAAPRKKQTEVLTNWMVAAHAAASKKAVDLKVLDLREVTSFADYFVICSGTNSRQVQAISDEVGAQMAKKLDEKPVSIEGQKNAEWILMDYGDMLVHVFSAQARSYYDLERLWRHATEVPLPED